MQSVSLTLLSLSLQIVETLFNALNQNLVQFELKPGVQVIVYVTQLTLGECLLGMDSECLSPSVTLGRRGW